MTTSRTVSWREFVEGIDDENRHRDSLYPVVYKFSGGVEKRDSGPKSGVYAGTST